MKYATHDAPSQEAPFTFPTLVDEVDEVKNRFVIGYTTVGMIFFVLLMAAIFR